MMDCAQRGNTDFASHSCHVNDSYLARHVLILANKAGINCVTFSYYVCSSV